LSNAEGPVGLSAPYWTEVTRQPQVVTQIYVLAMIVKRATGLRAFEPQLD
jgi:hypothetical protein